MHQQRMRDAIQRIAVGPDRGRDISAQAAQQIMQAVLAGQIDEVQVAVFLIALRMKRESMGEFSGLFAAIQDSIKPVSALVSELVCLADPFDGYTRHLSMTPFIPPVLAACGLTALLHGVETVGPKHGITASKVYQLAGIDTERSCERVATQLAEIGWGYIDQRVYAPDLFKLGELRDKIVKRTAVTTLERLLMPIKAEQRTHLVLGYVHKAYPEIYAGIAKQAGYASTLLIKGVEGGLAPALNKPLRRYFIERSNVDPLEDARQIIDALSLFDSDSAAQTTQQSGAKAVADCLELGLQVLAGKSGTARNSLCFAVGQIIYAHRHTDTLSAAVEKVQNCLDNGTALARFNNAP